MNHEAYLLLTINGETGKVVRASIHGENYDRISRCWNGVDVLVEAMVMPGQTFQEAREAVLDAIRTDPTHESLRKLDAVQELLRREVPANNCIAARTVIYDREVEDV